MRIAQNIANHSHHIIPYPSHPILYILYTNRLISLSLGETIKRIVQNIANQERRATALIEHFRDKQVRDVTPCHDSYLHPFTPSHPDTFITIATTITSPPPPPPHHHYHHPYPTTITITTLPYPTTTTSPPPLPRHHHLQEEREESQRKQLIQSQNTISVVLSIFSPLSFITGVYGMNFTNIPELSWQHGYSFFWGIVTVTTMVTVGGSLPPHPNPTPTLPSYQPPPMILLPCLSFLPKSILC